MSAVSGWLVDVVGWRGMFIIEGLPAIAWAFAFRALAEDHPRSARWLAEDEREDIGRRLEHEAVAEAQLRPSARDYVQALKERTVVLLALQYLLWSVGVYGFVFWLPTIVKVGSGYGNRGHRAAVGDPLRVRRGGDARGLLRLGPRAPAPPPAS
jgi:MFS family permease